MTACRQRQQWAALYRSCLLSVLVKFDAIGGLIECKRLVKCNANEWSVAMQSDGQVECNFAPWVYGDIKFTHRSEPVPSYFSHQPKRKVSLAAQAMERQRELDREWDHLRRQALHSVKDFFKQGGRGGDVPATFQAKVSPHGGGLNNHSLRFWP